MWPSEAICLPSLWLNRVGISIRRVIPVCEFSSTFCQLSSSQSRSLFAITLNCFPQKSSSATCQNGLNRVALLLPLSDLGLWLLPGPEAVRADVFPGAAVSLQRRQSGPLEEVMQFRFEKGSLEPLSSLEVDDGEAEGMERLRGLLLEVRNLASLLSWPL